MLLLVCLVLAMTASYAWWRHEYAVAGTPGQAPITSVEARESGLRSVAGLTAMVLSYAWGTFESDLQEAAAAVAPSYRAEFVRSLRAVEDETLANQVTVEASAVATSVVSAAPRKVVALVFVDQATTARGIAGQRVDQARVLVTMTRDGGEWRVSMMSTS